MLLISLPLALDPKFLAIAAALHAETLGPTFQRANGAGNEAGSQKKTKPACIVCVCVCPVTFCFPRCAMTRSLSFFTGNCHLSPKSPGSKDPLLPFTTHICPASKESGHHSGSVFWKYPNLQVSKRGVLKKDRIKERWHETKQYYWGL